MTNRREPEQGSPTTALLTLNFSLARSLARYHFSLVKTYLSLSLSVFFSLCVVLTWGCLSIASSLHVVGNCEMKAQT